MKLPDQHRIQLSSFSPEALENFSADSVQLEQDIRWAQHAIYRFFLDLVRTQNAEAVLLEFKSLFFECKSLDHPEVIRALYELIFNNQEREFRYTLKRTCYILINNWYAKRNYKAISSFVGLLEELTFNEQRIISESLRRLRYWLQEFVHSEDYQELKAIIASNWLQGTASWSDRYAVYRLVDQYTNPKNSLEQRQIARELAKQIQEKFKQDLALFTARCQSHAVEVKQLQNPTQLGGQVIDLIKHLVSFHLFDYKNYAHIFIQQVQDSTYQDFKYSLLNYLIFLDKDTPFSELLKKKLADKLNTFYQDHAAEPLSIKLILQTCNRLVNCLTTEDNQNPSDLFIFFLAHTEYLLLAVTLLKIVLICKYVHTHLDTCLAKLIHYYEAHSSEPCNSFVTFLEVFNVVFAIYADNARYNVVRVKGAAIANHVSNPDSFRVFSQFKGADLHNINLSGIDLRQVDFCGADLRGANLNTADLSGANLSLAKLSRATLIGAVLDQAALVAADLSGADLSNASLAQTNFSRANLQDANLSGSNLSGANLYKATLRQANLNSTNLSSANLSLADLSLADLSNADLQQVNLKSSNLQAANLSHANLVAAELEGAQLSEANLSHAKLCRANLDGTHLTGANLSKANLYRAQLNQTNLQAADLRDAFLRNATLSGANLSQTNLSGADLSRAELNHVDCHGALLHGAFLRHTQVSDSNFDQADLRVANVFGTNLLHVSLNQTRFGDNFGLSEEMGTTIKHHGGIFT